MVLHSEISLLRIVTRRVLILSSGEEDLETAFKLLALLSLASGRIAVLQRVQVILASNQSNGRYSVLEGETVYHAATASAQVNQRLTAEQQSTLLTHFTDLLSVLTFPTGANLYSQSIDIPELPHTDFLIFTQYLYDKIFQYGKRNVQENCFFVDNQPDNLHHHRMRQAKNACLHIWLKLRELSKMHGSVWHAA